MAKDSLKRMGPLPNYFDALRARAWLYQAKFPASPKKAAIRLIWWNFKSLFKRYDG